MAKKVCIIGLGFIGLPTACLIAEKGFDVLAIDNNPERINELEGGRLPFAEPGLEELFVKAKTNLRFSNTAEEADIFIICVPTPLLYDKTADLSYVEDALKEIVPYMKEGNLLITESTIPPLYHKETVEPKIGHLNHLHIAYVPERALVGETLKEMRGNDRIIGANTPEAAQIAHQLYSTFVTGEIHITDLISAEMIKLVENAYRDTNIAFVNDLAKTCDKIGANVWEIIRLANKHPRVNLHQPGPGVGGHCLPIDPWFMTIDSMNNQMIKTTRQVNAEMPYYIVNKIAVALQGIPKPKVVILGVAYKADVDDIRETPALKIGEEMISRGYDVVFHDPIVKKFAYPVSRNLGTLTQNADCLILVTNHSAYNELDPNIFTNMRHKKVFDTRNQLDADQWRKAGFEFKLLGSVETSYKKIQQ